MQRERQISILTGNRVMHGHELGAVGESAFDLHVINHFGHAGHDLVTTKQLTAEIHQLSHAFAVADEFQQYGGDKRDGFGMIQPQAARKSLLREETGLVQRQLVEFTRGKVHVKNSKFQAPSSREIPNAKHQFPASVRQADWSLRLGVSLWPGAWCLVLSSHYHLRAHGSSPRSADANWR